jgi:hypothetical protein
MHLLDGTGLLTTRNIRRGSSPARRPLARNVRTKLAPALGEQMKYEQQPHTTPASRR